MRRQPEGGSPGDTPEPPRIPSSAFRPGRGLRPIDPGTIFPCYRSISSSAPPGSGETLVASDPEHRPTEIGVAHDVFRAAERTVCRAI